MAQHATMTVILLRSSEGVYWPETLGFKRWMCGRSTERYRSINVPPLWCANRYFESLIPRQFPSWRIDFHLLLGQLLRFREKWREPIPTLDDRTLTNIEMHCLIWMEVHFFYQFDIPHDFYLLNLASFSGCFPCYGFCLVSPKRAVIILIRSLTPYRFRSSIEHSAPEKIHMLAFSALPG